MMKAWSIDRSATIDDLALRHHPIPSPKPDEALVRIQAAALNPGDMKVLTGRDGGRFIHSRRPPIILGFDFAGIVERVGTAVESVGIGAHVFGFIPYSSRTRQGTLAEYVVVKPEAVGLKPDGVSYEEAASAATVACTALQGLRDKGRLSNGHRVLINGASGGVGSFAIQMAKNASAEVWATASARNLEFVQSLGADHAVDYRATRLDELPGPFDIILDCAATSSYGEVESILNGVYITLLPNFSTVTGKLSSLFSSKRCTYVVVSSNTADLNEIGNDLATGRLKAPIAATYDMDDVPEALRCLEKGEKPGKIAVRIEA